MDLIQTLFNFKKSSFKTEAVASACVSDLDNVNRNKLKLKKFRSLNMKLAGVVLLSTCGSKSSCNKYQRFKTIGKKKCLGASKR